MLVSTQLIAVLVLSISFPTPSVATAAAAHWHKDEAFEAESADVLCDFPVFDPKKDSFEEFAEAPFIIADDALSASWPAHRRWQKDNFIHSYGNRMINYDSHSSIVYGGGEAGIPITLRDLLAAMDVMYERNSTITASSPSTHSSDAAAAATTTTECEVEDGSCSSGSNDSETAAGWAVESDAFVFDTTIMRAIPELKDDITVPSIFANWHNQQTEERGDVRSMLSLGPSRSGLPFHSHGETWLAVVHGAKRWFVYPPGCTPLLPLMQSFNPMLPLQRWFTDIYPLLTDATTGYPKPPLGIAANQQHSTFTDTAAIVTTYRPLECVQRAGQLVFLPSRWSHMTMNIGETVAFGGQAGLGTEDRLTAAEKVLEWNPHDFEALKDAGLGRMHLVSDLKDNIVSVFDPAAPLFRMQPDQKLVYLMQHTEDPFVVLLLNINHWKTSPQQVKQRIVSAWQQLALQLIDTANVDVVGLRELRNGSKSDDVATGNFLFDPAMSVVVYHGANKKLNSNRKSNGASSVLLYDAEYYGTDCSEELLEDYRQLVAAEKLSLEEARQRYFSDVDGLAQCVHNVMQRHNITSGSMAGKHGMTASQRGFEQSINHLKRAIEVKPQSPEVRFLLATVQGNQRDFGAMKATIESAKTVYDAIHESQQLSKQSRAALYHQLATIYISVGLHLESLPYMEMSLKVLPSYVPALVDRVIAHVLHLQQKMRTAEREQALQFNLQLLQQVEVQRRSEGDEAGAVAVAAERKALISNAASLQTPTVAAASYLVVSPEELNSLLAALQQLQAVAPKHPQMSQLQSAVREIEQATLR